MSSRSHICVWYLDTVQCYMYKRYVFSCYESIDERYTWVQSLSFGPWFYSPFFTVPLPSRAIIVLFSYVFILLFLFHFLMIIFFLFIFLIFFSSFIYFYFFLISSPLPLPLPTTATTATTTITTTTTTTTSPYNSIYFIHRHGFFLTPSLLPSILFLPPASFFSTFHFLKTNGDFYNLQESLFPASTLANWPSYIFFLP